MICPCIQEDDIIITNSHTAIKFSFHVIVDKWCFPNNDNNQGFFNALMNIFPTKWKDGVDHTMYKHHQQFRIFGCHKYGKNNVKKLDPLSKWQLPLQCKNEKHQQMIILLASLVTNTSYCKILPSFSWMSIKKIYVGEETIINDSDIEKVMLMCAKFEECEHPDDIDFPYKIDTVKGSLIILRRCCSSLCKVCDRVHDSQNPYLAISHNRNVYFDCRRNAHNKRELIGNLDGNTAEPALPKETLTIKDERAAKNVENILKRSEQVLETDSNFNINNTLSLISTLNNESANSYQPTKHHRIDKSIVSVKIMKNSDFKFVVQTKDKNGR